MFRNRADKSLLNRLGFNNKGVEALVENLKKENQYPIGVSIGKNFDTPNELGLQRLFILYGKGL